MLMGAAGSWEAGVWCLDHLLLPSWASSHPEPSCCLGIPEDCFPPKWRALYVLPAKCPRWYLQVDLKKSEAALPVLDACAGLITQTSEHTPERPTCLF